ncbi:MAG: Eco57I restriction-modification methylase domain-containing protein [Candidatus Rokuibacteriota bacterium]
MSVARHHVEWLSLVETSGPFLSMPVLLRAFPQELDKADADHTRSLRLAHEEWEESQERHPDPAFHTAWVRFVLTETLGLPTEVLAEGPRMPAGLRVMVAEHGEVLAPDLVVVNPDGTPGAGRPRLLVQVYPARQDLRRAVAASRWKVSPETRMVELLRGTDTRLGLVTNGEHWMLVSVRPGEPAGFASWYAALWLEEPLTLRAFRSLLGAHRFFSVAESETLEALLAESAADQQEVTDQLGLQVRRAVELLVAALDRADRDHGRALLRDVPDARLYEAAVTAMMRLVFLFAAEERGLLLLGDPLYDQHYAISTLRAQLRETADRHGEEVLEQRIDAWCRLLATFRTVHSGMRHDRLTLPAYGGSLFDPDRFPFLEGRGEGTSWRTTAAAPLPVNNRTVLHLLEALQMLEVRLPGGGPAEARRLSFRALDIEQIGHVYEGLLDHTAARAPTPVIGLVGTREGEAEVPLDSLERLRADGEARLVEFLSEETGRQPTTIRRALAYEPVGEDVHRLLVACDNDERLERRVRPFAGLVREDTRGYPVVIPPGSVYVTRGSDRRTTGTHYTPRSLTEPIVRYTLEPLVYEGPAEGWRREEWRLRPARDLFALRVCDMAMGSGAFLVQVCRFLSERLVEAWEETERQHPGAPGITPEGAVATGAAEERLIPKDTEERLALGRRLVADRCLYGVDKNPMAVEMAKLSLWLVTLQKDRPFTFLDHALKSGDSLLGVTSAEQIEWAHLDPQKGRQLPFWAALCAPALRTAVEKRRQLESFTVETVVDAEEKARLLREAEAALGVVRLIGDLIVGAGLSTAGKKASALDERLDEIGELVRKTLSPATPTTERETQLLALRERARTMLGIAGSASPVPFHWALEFPEIFDATRNERCGFDAIVGNPPFLTGTSISTFLGPSYRAYLNLVWPHLHGRADLCVVFMLRGAQLCPPKGAMGFVGSNTTSETDSRLSGPAYLLSCGFSIYRAVKSQPWLGGASVHVCQVHYYNGSWRGAYVLDGVVTASINSSLDAAQEGPEPHTLLASKAKSYTGTKVYGEGFIVADDEALTLLSAAPEYSRVVKPFLIGREVNEHPECAPSRYVIDFTGMTAEQAKQYPLAWRIVDERVRPQRQSAPESRMRRVWWQFQRPRLALYERLRTLGVAWIVAATSDTVAFVGLRIGPERPLILSHAVNVMSLDGYGEFAVVQSSIHLTWARRYGSTLKGDFRYTTTDCFDTFPFPERTLDLEAAGKSYHEYRQNVMRTRGEGLTAVYRRFNDATESGVDILRLRSLHADVDRGVAAAYGWTSLDLGHGFHETKQGLRFTISEPARQEVLARLLHLNHARYADELRRGLHAKKSRSRRNDQADGDALFELDRDNE